MAEAMHKKCLHNTLEVVETPVVHCICLNWVNNALSFVAEEFINRKVVEDWVDKEGTQVFEKEERAVGNLWSQVLKYHSEIAGVTITVVFYTLLAAKNNWLFLRSRSQRKSKPLSGRIELLGCGKKS